MEGKRAFLRQTKDSFYFWLVKSNAVEFYLQCSCMLCSAVQYRSIRCSSVQFYAVPCMLYSAVAQQKCSCRRPGSAVAMQETAGQCSLPPCSTPRPSRYFTGCGAIRNSGFVPIQRVLSCTTLQCSVVQLSTVP